MEIEINVNGEKKKVRIREPKGAHERRWLEFLDKSENIKEFYALRDEILMELCDEYNTTEKLDELEAW